MGRCRVVFRFKLAIVIVTTAVLQLAACGDSESPTALDSQTTPVVTQVLRPDSDLSPGCYDWPVPDLSVPDVAGYALPFEVGDPAIDFTLKDTEGVPHNLSELLDTRPVLIVFGAYT